MSRKGDKPEKTDTVVTLEKKVSLKPGSLEPRAPTHRLVVPATLDALDALEAEALVLLVPQDQRPWQGAVGLLDWRMCGWLGEQARIGRIVGYKGEYVLTTPNGRLGVPTVIMIGVGEARHLATSVAVVLKDVQRVVENARVKAIVLAGCCSGDVLAHALDGVPALKERVKAVMDGGEVA